MLSHRWRGAGEGVLEHTRPGEETLKTPVRTLYMGALMNTWHTMDWIHNGALCSENACLASTQS